MLPQGAYDKCVFLNRSTTEEQPSTYIYIYVSKLLVFPKFPDQSCSNKECDIKIEDSLKLNIP